MHAYAGSPPPRSGDVVGTLRLMAYLAVAVALIVLDHRGGWLAQIRARGELVVQPLWWLAGAPGRIGDTVRDSTSTRARLADENRILRNALLISGARLSRLQAAAAENARLRGLLGAGQRGGLDVQLAPILDVDLDPTRQRLILDSGARDGVQLGQTVIDAGGLLGQIIAVTAGTATVLLITDPDHAVPVVVARNGVRLVAYGKGRSDRLELANIPLSSDIKVGDHIVTSGLGGRFPAGFAVGTVITLQPDDSRAFLVGQLKPAAQLDRGRDVLLLKSRDLGRGVGDLEGRAPQPSVTAGASAGTASPRANPAPHAASGAAPDRHRSPPPGQPSAPSPQPRTSTGRTP